MSKLTTCLVVEYEELKILLFEEKNGELFHFFEKRISYDGFKVSGFVNPEDVFLKVQNAIEYCENSFGRVDKKINVILPAVFYKYSLAERETEVVDGTVKERDISALYDGCTARLPGYELTEIMPISYKTALNPSTLNPIGEKTAKLAVKLSLGYLKLGVKELFDNCAKRLNREFEYFSYGSLIAEKAFNFFKTKEERIIIYFSCGHTDILLTDGNAPVDVRSELWGEQHIVYALSEVLNVDEGIAAELVKSVNLNLKFDDKDVYYVTGRKFSVKHVNGVVGTSFEFFAKELSKDIKDIKNENLPVYLTGTRICQRRGVRELFEDVLGREVIILDSAQINAEGCENYLKAAIGESQRISVS